MPLLSLTHTLSDARAQWLGGDTHAWARYVECCLQLEAELRKAQRANASARSRSSDAPSPSGQAGR